MFRNISSSLFLLLMSPPFGIGLMTNDRDYESHGKITFQITGEMFVTPEVLSNFIPSISHSSPGFFFLVAPTNWHFI